MSITNPTEEYFKDGLWGWVTNQWKKLIADAAGHLQVDVLTSGLPTGGATAANQATMITALQLIDDLRNALHSIATDELDVIVESSALPTGAATAANQTTMITALQLIDDLRNALDSVGTDELDVNVEASVLPTGAATAANQTTMITALQLIDDLRAALNSVGTDELDVVIDGQAADIEVTQTAPADLTTAPHGWDGAAWRKLPLIWGYSDRYAESEAAAGVAAGSHNLDFSTVPSGEVWVVTIFGAWCTTSNPTTVRLQHYDGSTTHTLHIRPLTTAMYTYEITTPIILKEGDYLRARFTNCALNDNLYAQVNGYKMKVAE